MERLYLKVPNTDKLRKNAAGRHKHLLAAGWREMERRPEVDHLWVRYERTGPTPLRLRLPRPDKDQGRFERRPAPRRRVPRRPARAPLGSLTHLHTPRPNILRFSPVLTG